MIYYQHVLPYERRCHRCYSHAKPLDKRQISSLLTFFSIMLKNDKSSWAAKCKGVFLSLLLLFTCMLLSTNRLTHFFLVLFLYYSIELGVGPYFLCVFLCLNRNQEIS
ncbi:hypothetical protein wTpre_798 [Wolbachia endosymbiont of Trichogramma pretiosum]|nr:hypothetical protein wTpre_798 [Wolbachia endosymbiont of Trichogramma pretiosum]